MYDTSIYIHIPFCIRRCGYCDFNTYAGLQGLIPAYAEAVRRELDYLTNTMSARLAVHTLFFGGGTPSLLPEEMFERIIGAVRKNFSLAEDAEITIEANPGTVKLEHLRSIHGCGVNRISLGMQSVNTKELIMLERQHTFMDVVQAVEWARTAGIDNLNLDLIYGLPRQTLEMWLNSLNAALSLMPEHLSLYALTIEQGTPMQHLVEKGTLPQPDDDLAADMYDAAREILAAQGYIQYEISNWARRNHSGELLACKHNLQYWRNLPYLGVGAGAHGFIEHHRTVDVLQPNAYINRMKSRDIAKENLSFPNTPATIQSNFIDQDTEIGETMMTGLRLVDEGVSSLDFQNRFGMELQDRFGQQIDHFLSVGLLAWAGEKGNRLRLTPKAYLIGNQVFMDFI
jgi:oxygen-independent coproporphyrinogen III oxidase